MCWMWIEIFSKKTTFATFRWNWTSSGWSYMWNLWNGTTVQKRFSTTHHPWTQEGQLLWMSYLPKPFHLKGEPGASCPTSHRSEANVRLWSVWFVVLHLFGFAGALLQRSYGCIRMQVYVVWKNIRLGQVAPKTFTFTFRRATTQLLLLSSGILFYFYIFSFSLNFFFVFFQQTFKWKTHLVRHKQTVHANLSKSNKGSVRKTEKINEGKFFCFFSKNVVLVWIIEDG